MEEALITVGIPNPDKARNSWFLRKTSWIPRCCYRPLGGPVIGPPAGNDLIPSGICPCDLYSILIGRGSPNGEKALGEISGGYLCQKLSQLSSIFIGEGGAHVADLIRLLLNGLDDLGMLVPSVYVDQLGAEIEVSLALFIPETASPGLGNDKGFKGLLGRP